MEEAAPPPRPMFMAGPPSTMRAAPTGSPFLDVLAADVADAARQHDGLVVAAHLDAVVARHLLFEGTEVTQDGRATEFVVEGGAAKGLPA